MFVQKVKLSWKWLKFWWNFPVVEYFHVDIRALAGLVTIIGWDWFFSIRGRESLSHQVQFKLLQHPLQTPYLIIEQIHIYHTDLSNALARTASSWRGVWCLVRDDDNDDDDAAHNWFHPKHHAQTNSHLCYYYAWIEMTVVSNSEEILMISNPTIKKTSPSQTPDNDPQWYVFDTSKLFLIEGLLFILMWHLLWERANFFELTNTISSARSLKLYFREAVLPIYMDDCVLIYLF